MPALLRKFLANITLAPPCCNSLWIRFSRVPMLEILWPQISTCNSKCLPLWLSNRGSCNKSLFVFSPCSILRSMACLLWSVVIAFSRMITCVFRVAFPTDSEFKWWHNLCFKSSHLKISFRKNPSNFLWNTVTETETYVYLYGIQKRKKKIKI